MTTVGGALVGLVAALVVLFPFWHKGRKKGSTKTAPGTAAPTSSSRRWADLQEFGFGFALGTLCSLCSGGLLGGVAARMATGSNSIGSRALAVLTGAASPSVARRAQEHLTPGGAVVLVLLVVAAVLWWRQTGRTVHRDMVCGLISGVTLGPTAGIAGLAAVALAPAVNQVGGWLVGLL